MALLASLLLNTEKLLRATILVSVIPLLLSLVPQLTTPVFYALTLMFFMVNMGKIKDKWLQFKKTDPIIKMQIGFAMVGLIIFLWVIWVGLALQPNLVINTLLAVIVYLSWFSIVNDELDEYPYQPILRGHVDQFDLSRSFDAMVIPSTVSGFIGIAAVLTESFISSRGQELLTVASLRWLAIPVLIMFHGTIHALVFQELNWTPTYGVTTYKEKPIPTPPTQITPQSLTAYFTQVERAEPHDQFFVFLDDNIELLVDQFRTLYFAQSLHRLVRIYSYWGTKAADKLQYLHLLVASSLSRFRVLGIVPLYNRFMFYSYLELLAKLQLLPDDWYEIIAYEVKEQKDDFHRLDWFVGVPYGDIHDKLRWISLWDGNIYRGAKGYALLQQEDFEQYELGEMEPWVEDTWEVVFDYLKLFVGPEGREAFTGNFSLDEALDFLARKETMKDYHQDKERRKADLENPKDRLVDTSEKKKNTELQQAQMNAYFGGKGYNEYQIDIGLATEFSLLLRRIKQVFLGSNQTIIKWLVIIVIAAINTGILLVLKPLIPLTTLQLIVAVEVILFQFFGISGSGEGIMDQETAGNKASIQPNEQFGEKSLESSRSFGSAESLIFSILLIIGYYLFLS